MFVRIATSAALAVAMSTTVVARDYVSMAGSSTVFPFSTSVAEQFEAMFVYQLLKSGRAAKLYDDPLNTSAAKPFLQMMDQEISQKVSNKRSLGIAEAIVAQFERK